MVSDINKQEWTNILNGRIFIYEILIYLLSKEPEIDGLIELSKQEELKRLGGISEGAELINDYLKIMKIEETDSFLKSTREEYQRLFVGPAPIQVPIWESVYFDPEKLMFGERTMVVRAFYKKYSFEFVRKNKEPEDHLAIELEFMLFLNKKTLEAQKDDEARELIKDQLLFLNNHLLTWIEKFAKLLFNRSESLLYKGTVLLLKEFLLVDKDTLYMMEEELDDGKTIE